MAKNKRLDKIVSLIQPDQILLDIGSDHGLVIKKAIDLGIINKAIAADISVNALNNAKTNLTGYPVKFVLSNGFENIDAPFEQVVIAGMGALNIIQILNKAPKERHITYVLQANDRHHQLRKFLAENDFVIIDETLVYDGFYYVLMVVNKGSMQMNLDDLYLGPILKTKSISKKYYQEKYSYYNHLIQTHGHVSNEILEAYHILKRALNL